MNNMLITKAKERALLGQLMRHHANRDVNNFHRVKTTLENVFSNFIINERKELLIMERELGIHDLNDDEITKKIEKEAREIIKKLEESTRNEEYELELKTLEIEYRNSKEYKLQKSKKTISNGELRKCYTCLLDKKPEFFGFNKQNRDGLNTTCKKCRSKKELSRTKKPIDKEKQRDNYYKRKNKLDIEYNHFKSNSIEFLKGLGYKVAIGLNSEVYVNEYADFKKLSSKHLKGEWTIKDVKPYINYHGYYAINNIPVHRVMAYTFLNHKPKGFKIVVDHINNNKLDNSVKNLQLITTFENLAKGRFQSGGNNKFEKHITHIKY